jgi:hypothetical protein
MAESEEREREEEEEEEMEVLGAVTADITSESEYIDDVVMHDYKADEEDIEEGENSDESESDDREESDEEEEERGRTTSKDPRKSVWRKSLERIWPFRSSSPGSKEDVDDEEDGNVRYSCLLV